MNNRRVQMLVAAVAVAAITAFAAFNYVAAADDRAFGEAELVEVFVVKKDVIKGFPGERALDEGFVAKDRVPRKFVPARALVDGNHLRGKVAVTALAAGLPVVDDNFVEPRLAQESFAQRIETGHQAVTLALSDVEGVARLVVPGDRVNMMLTSTDPKDQAAGEQTQFVMQAIEVLAIGNSTELLPGEQPPVDTTQAAGTADTVQSGLITFSVPALDAERLVHASKSGSIHLTLVPPDFAPAPVAPVNRGNLFN